MIVDLLIAAVVLMFTLTTLPMIRARVKLPLLTTVPMVVGSAVLVVCYLTLGLWFAFAVELLSLALWFVLLRRSIA